MRIKEEKILQKLAESETKAHPNHQMEQRTNISLQTTELQMISRVSSSFPNKWQLNYHYHDQGSDLELLSYFYRLMENKHPQIPNLTICTIIFHILTIFLIYFPFCLLLVATATKYNEQCAEKTDHLKYSWESLVKLSGLAMNPI